MKATLRLGLGCRGMEKRRTICYANSSNCMIGTGIFSDDQEG